MGKRLPEQEVRALIMSYGFEMVGKYMGSRDKIDIRCKKGHLIRFSLDRIRKQGIKCYECREKRENRSFTNEYIDRNLPDGWKRLSDYVRWDVKMELLCPQNHRVFRNWNRIQVGRITCTHCSTKRTQWTNGIIDKALAQRGYSRMSDYKNGRVQVLCDKGHEFTANTNSLKRKRRCAKCVSNEQKGENHPNWNKSLSQEERRKRRNIPDIRKWRSIVLKRDRYTCQVCLKTNLPLVVHHLYNYAQYPSLRADINNGVTVCSICHAKGEYAYHRLCGRKDNSPAQFLQWKFYAIQYLALREIAG